MSIDSPTGEDLPISIVQGAATPEEIAAVVAVVSEHYAAEHDQAVAEDKTRSAWSVSQRGLRQPLQRELGWRHTAC
ncbi:hypothetical protein GCM10009808_02450 [Microbacterium sediminicola]|uniref:Acyl-CoA carboxylase epsilon subunit n=1 Tax=Microbacterium sediminicola TaxID=415210 RepID=A0ABN2HJH0_9MICO